MITYQFQNLLYIHYGLSSRYVRDKKTLYIERSLGFSNPFRRAIGEEITDFLRVNKDKELTII